MVDESQRKGERTRARILGHAVRIACRVGLGGLTIGDLAEEVGLSKSGMYAHFGSKQALQVAVLDAAAHEFAVEVVGPALRGPRGEPRLRVLVEGWLRCAAERRPGGCVFVKATTELDEQPGPVRDHLRALHRELATTIARVVTGGVTEGHFGPGTDPDQFATDLHGVMLAYYRGHRLLEDPRAERHARTAVEALLTAARVGAPHPYPVPRTEEAS
ncbi:TetR/AcrR family transcriptional regulator [Cellulomonas bogoriensis]|uniref:TetR family transcriptional regulator n=1 Tax=Cellulomonas bogoriensis 69B4 = DSM 16987 TaxID=1386082 RepID=A0A0A0BMP7_9CELL|nr:TetR/AcrR family transcriptional regulator [Cellulomonas bogoriensis]KGM09748.1 TetR family transcriptional regulator [Cellulomonas bogoriensis 69B4 = DSM 16987]